MFEIEEHIETDDFRESFWEWWDNETDRSFRDKFNYYDSDMAKIYYFNQIYRKRFQSSGLK